MIDQLCQTLRMNKITGFAPASRTMLHRIYFIDRRIAAGGYPSTKTLAAEYETGTATISRDIDLMRTMMNAPIAYDALRRGYYYTDKTYRLPAGFSTAEDMMALGIAKNLLSIYRDTPLYNTVRYLIDSITAPMASDKDSGWFENRVLVPKTASAPIPEDIWHTILAALRENRVLSFDYLGAWNTGYKSRSVRPYQFLFDNGVWFLYGFDEKRDAIRMYSLPRIKNIVLTDKRFLLPADYNYSACDDGSYFGVFAGGKKQCFKIEFCDDSIVWIEERLWAADQKITKDENTAAIEFTSTQLAKVLDWILSLGCTARPLAPKELVDLWKWHIEEMAKIAKNLLRSICM
jgi:predicted DNA-binding transcriptional regulator YafY